MARQCKLEKELKLVQEDLDSADGGACWDSQTRKTTDGVRDRMTSSLGALA